MTDRMRRVLTALLATELVGGPVVHFDETTNHRHRLHRVEHLDLFRPMADRKAPDALIERAGEETTLDQKRPRTSSGEPNYP